MVLVQNEGCLTTRPTEEEEGLFYSAINTFHRTIDWLCFVLVPSVVVVYTVSPVVVHILTGKTDNQQDNKEEEEVGEGYEGRMVW